MKKYYLIGIVMMLLMVSSVNALTNKTNFETITADFTHTVLIEKCTATWCSNCPIASEALENVYESGDYSFYYLSLVDDMNTIAKQRNKDFTMLLFPVYAFPTIYLDGGNTNFVGHEGTVTATETAYRSVIEQEGQRTTKQPITLNSTVTWDGNAKLTASVEITNEGNFFYFGKLRSYVTEIASRWNDYDGNPYHYAFIDYAINKFVFLMPGQSKTITGSFDGTLDHGGETFEDLTSDNVIVISAISHWMPQYRIGYESTEYTQRYFANVVDQTTAATPT